MGIGVRPNLDLVRDLPVQQDRGILVNGFMQTNQPTLFAAGDAAQVYDRWTKEHNLDILWPSAINEGRAAGTNMVEVAHGASPRYRYEKGSPFNCALLFGRHLTVVGRIGPATADNGEQLAYLSRGSSRVWTLPFGSADYHSAWDKDGFNSLRVTMSGGRIVGAMILGNQELADPLRQFVERGVDLGPYQASLSTGGAELPQTLLQAWRDWHQRW